MTREELINSFINRAAYYVGKLQKGTVSMQPVCDVWNSQNPKPHNWTMTVNSEYCASLQTVISIETGMQGIFTKECGAYEMMKGEKTAGRFFVEKTKAARGDLIFYFFGTNYHVGVVENADASAIYTIEGNINGGKCERKTVKRDNSDVSYKAIQGFSRPAYDKVIVNYDDETHYFVSRDCLTLEEAKNIADGINGNVYKDGAIVYTANKEPVTKKAKTNVNVRSGAGTSYAVRYVLQKGQTVQLTGNTENRLGTEWDEIVYNGKTGWVSAKYLE